MVATILLVACLAVAPHGVCAAEGEPTISPSFSSIPHWATNAWRDYAGSIVAGETVPNCDDCHLWIACTMLRDVERGYHPWSLYPGRWHGWGIPRPEHRRAVWYALQPGGCDGVPHCRFLGNVTDYLGCWSPLGPAQIVGNQRAAIVCVPW